MFKDRSNLLYYLLMFVAGLLSATAYAPLEISPVIFLTLALLFWYWQQASPAQVWWSGWSFGTGLFLAGVSWVYISMTEYGQVHPVFAGLLSLLFALFLGLFPALAGWLARRYFARSDALLLLLAVPACWALMEWTRSWFLTGFPWLNIGITQAGLPISGYAPLLGEYGVSWLVALLPATFVFYLKLLNKIRFVVLLGLLLFLWAGSYLQQYPWTQPQGKPFRVALVQGNVDQDRKWDPNFRQAIFENYLKLSKPHWQADLVIWPETAVSAFYHHVPEMIDVMESLAVDTNTHMLVGIPFKNLQTREYYNSILALGGKRTFYHKRHLVPFGEFIPFQKQLHNLLDIMGLPMQGFARGDVAQGPLAVGPYLAGLTVCYEIIFNSEVTASLPSAHFLVNVSNNTWFGDSSMPYQQLQMARMRAIETGRYVLSATNNGVSAVVNQQGKIIATSPQFQEHVLSVNVQAYTGATPFVRWGNYPILIVLGLLLCVARWLPISRISS